MCVLLTQAPLTSAITSRTGATRHEGLPLSHHYPWELVTTQDSTNLSNIERYEGAFYSLDTCYPGLLTSVNILRVRPHDWRRAQDHINGRSIVKAMAMSDRFLHIDC